MTRTFIDTIKRNLKIQRLRIKKPEYIELVKDNASFLNIHKGERCFILGNGPSIKSVDFSQLEKEYVFTVNQMPRNPQFENLKTNYHVWADERFFHIDKEKPEDMELLEVMKSVNTKESSPVVFYKSSALPMVKQFGLADELNVRFYNEIYINNIREALDAGIDLTKALPSFSTVIQYAICIAIYMGFEHIYLLGCDCTGFISTAQQKMNAAEKSLYAYDISDNEKKRMEKSMINYSIKNELKWYVDLFDTYEIIGKYAVDNGIEIYNAGMGGLLDCYPRKNLDAILREKV